MSPSKKDLEQLRVISMAPAKLQKQLLKKIDSRCIKTICECTLNTLKGNIRLSKKQKKSLSKHKNTLRTLAFKKLSLKKKRNLLVQKGGGFLSLLLPSAISLISGLIHGSK